MSFIGGEFKKGKDVYINRLSYIAGSVEVGDNVSIWPGASLRGDEDYIKIGNDTNIQDNATVHVSENFHVEIGNGVTIGHNAIVHGCIIRDNVMIGMGATVLDGAIIGSGSIIGAGALISGGKIIPENSIVVGNPYKIIRESGEKDFTYITSNTKTYVILAKEYLKRGN